MRPTPENAENRYTLQEPEYETTFHFFHVKYEAFKYAFQAVTNKPEICRPEFQENGEPEPVSWIVRLDVRNKLRWKVPISRPFVTKHEIGCQLKLCHGTK